MRDLISYEWVMEEIENREGDIIDPQFCDTLKEALAIEPDEKALRVEIALVRFEGNEFDGIRLREYAYLNDGKLPEEFEDGYKVPKRFHDEVKKAA